jgi:Cof subfamily protein (haloacid dehalogenase superfamily)
MKHWAKEPTGINKVMAIGHESVIATVESKLVSVFPSGLNIYTSKPTYLEIMREDASKTKAVQFLMERYGIRREEIIAIGDNFNDKEMIAYAGTGVAMGNAPDAIKAVADYITDTNQRDGVRKAIERFIPL